MPKRSSLPNIWLGTAILLAAGVASAQDPLSISVRSVYEGQLRSDDLQMLSITVGNNGRDAQGTILIGRVDRQSRQLIPVQLPRGSTKEYRIAVSPTGLAPITLQTNVGSVQTQAAIQAGYATTSLLVIGSTPGGFSGLTKDKTSQSASSAPLTTVAYAKPEDAPTLESQYGAISVVAVGAGAERLSDDSVLALQQYALRGGHVVFFGGASLPFLSDPRFRSLLPMKSVSPRNIGFEGQTITVADPTPTEPASREEIAGIPIVRGAYGAGFVTFFSADPLSDALVKSSRRNKTLNSVFQLLRSNTLAAAAYPNQEFQYDPYSGNSRRTSFGSAAPTTYGATNDANDPFNLRIPETAKIFWVLATFFVVVLPVNFLVLRIFKRLEWAWYTTPLISLAFAAVLFRNAGSLYGAKLSTAATTNVYACANDGRAIAAGEAQIFFPSPQSVDFKIANPTSITDGRGTGYDYRYGSNDNSKPLDVIMLDRPLVPNYSTGSLEFREVGFHQQLDLGSGVEIVPQSPGYRVTNRTPYPLRGLLMANTSGNRPLAYRTQDPNFLLKPGETATLASFIDVNSVPHAQNSRYGPVLIAQIEGLRTGPELGEPVLGRTSTQLTVSMGGAK